MTYVDPYLMRIIKQEVTRQVNVILTGVSGEDDPSLFVQDIEQLYPGSSTITKRPIMHPYGFVSRAPRGILQVVARQGEHPGNRLIIGYRDAERPVDLDEGTAKMYSLAGFQIYAGPDGIYVGKGSAEKALMLGTETNEFFTQLLDLLIAHVHPSPGSPSDKSADFTQLKAEVVESKSLISTGDGGLS